MITATFERRGRISRESFEAVKRRLHAIRVDPDPMLMAMKQAQKTEAYVQYWLSQVRTIDV